MDCRSPNSTGKEPAVRLQITELLNGQKQPSDNWGSGSTMFEPQRDTIVPPERTESTENSISTARLDQAPEKKLTLLALQLAVLEKTASGLGTLGFIWATVVLLGGFAITLDKNDFWFLTIILVIEGTRIFSRSHELEWQQHQPTWTITDAGRFSFRALKTSSNRFLRTVKVIFHPILIVRKETNHSRELKENASVEVPRNHDQRKSLTRTWPTSEVPLLPYTKWVFVSRNISKFLYWLQLLSAIACVSLSLTRLIQQRFGEINKGDSDKRNRKSALNIFYGLALAEALLFLLERAYWEWKISYCKLLEEVNSDCDLGNDGLASIKRFFYDAYSRCVNGSIFDGLRMDLISFAGGLLASNSSEEQLSGARILRKFTNSKQFSSETLRKIGTSTPVMERLVEMLSWKNLEEEEIRKSAADILSKLAGKKQNSLRVAGIPGAMEAISSLLYTGQSASGASDEICHKKVIADQVNYEFSAFNHLGLLILKRLSHDHDNCGKIGNTRGLLPKIIDFTHTREGLLKNNYVTESQIMVVKRSLQLVKMLVSTTGNTGKILRQEISEIVFTISNIREILQYGEDHIMLQKLGIEILTSLALDDDAKEKIGSTGGVIKQLFGIFFRKELPESQVSVRAVAGEALAMLALESESNCNRISRVVAVEKLVGALNDPVLNVNSARILRNLCAYGGSNCFLWLKGVVAATPMVLKATMFQENKLQEAAIGLAAQIFRFMSSQESSIEFEKNGIKETELAEKLVHILQKHPYPSIKVPRIRRFVIELAIWMMKDKEKNIQIFKDLGMEKELGSVAETTSELEYFNVFSGSVGMCRHNRTIHSLVDTALELLADARMEQYKTDFPV